MFWVILFFIISLVALIGGAELLIRGATRIATICKISPLVVGLTIVAFGTSAPELAVCTLASWRGEGDLLIGNIVGSNIFNILLVLGVSALVSPIVIKKKLIRWDVPLMIGVSLLMWFFAWGGKIYRWEGVLLFAGIIAYILFSIRYGREKELPSPAKQPFWLQIGMVVVGVILLGWGADGLIKSALIIAKRFGVSDLTIGLTLTAVGTSLPELATSLLALFRGQREVAVGNVIGSNLFNILAVLGLSALVAPHGISVPHRALTIDIPIMIGVALLTLPIFFTGRRISRPEGLFFLLAYSGYLLYLFL
ncbi:MAG: Inner membrane protein YrbG [Chlamydiae bacterium]|nr:Inner membrane protein YrbG [Chlamydiota bacterium]